MGSTYRLAQPPRPGLHHGDTGKLTYYVYDDPNCTPHIVSAGQGFVDNGRGHMVRNESGAPAQDMSVIIAPPSPPGPPNNFRGELDAPNPNCGF